MKYAIKMLKIGLFIFFIIIFNFTYYNQYNYKNVYEINKLHNSQNVNLLWEFDLGENTKSSPALGDIDNDGKLEVIVGSNDCNIYAINGEDGTLNWNYTTGDVVTSSPALGDIDNDGKLEVVVGSNDCNIYAINGEDGTLNWNYTTGDAVTYSPALGDIDNDGKLEIIIGVDNVLHVLNGEDGSLAWNYNLDIIFLTSSPIIVDIDADRKLDIAVGGSVLIGGIPENPPLGCIVIINGDDGDLDYYPYLDIIPSIPIIGDIDGDRKFELIVGGLKTTFSYSNENLYAINCEDKSLAWIYNSSGIVGSSPALGDLDGDGKLEIISGIDDVLHVLNGEDGTLAWNYTTADNVNSPPSLGDLDGDGKLEVIIVTSKIICLNPVQSGKRIYWQGFSGDTTFNRMKNQKNIDADFDMLSKYTENIYGTDPNKADTDGDGFSDYEELFIYHTDPTNSLNNPNQMPFIITIAVVTPIIILISLYGSYRLYLKNNKVKSEKKRESIPYKKKEIIKLYIKALKKIKNKLYTKNTIELLELIAQESKKNDLLDLYNDALRNIDFCRENIKIEKKKEIKKLYNFAKLKLDNEQYTEETINLFNEVIKESNNYGLKEIYSNAINDLEQCQAKFTTEIIDGKKDN